MIQSKPKNQTKLQEIESKLNIVRNEINKRKLQNKKLNIHCWSKDDYLFLSQINFDELLQEIEHKMNTIEEHWNVNSQQSKSKFFYLIDEDFNDTHDNCEKIQMLLKPINEFIKMNINNNNNNNNNEIPILQCLKNTKLVQCSISFYKKNVHFISNHKDHKKYVLLLYVTDASINFESPLTNKFEEFHFKTGDLIFFEGSKIAHGVSIPSHNRVSIQWFFD